MSILNPKYQRDPAVPGSDPIVEAIEQLQEDVEQINNKITLIDDDIDTINSDLEDVTVDVNNLADTLDVVDNHEFYGSRYKAWYHVDNINGDDSNDGLTWDTAFATLEHCLRYANTAGVHDLRIALVESSIPYTLNDTACAVNCWHMTGFYRATHTAFAGVVDGSSEQPPVTVTFSDGNRPFAIYATHVNWQGIIFNHVPMTTADYEREIYCDGGLVLMQSCRINCRYSQNGGSLWLGNCFLNQLRLQYANTRFFHENTFAQSDGTVDTRIRIDVVGGTFTVDSSAGGNGILHLHGGNVRQMRFRSCFVSFTTAASITMTTASGEYADYNATFDNCVRIMSETQLNVLRTSPGIADTDVLTIQGNTRLVNGSFGA